MAGSVFRRKSRRSSLGSLIVSNNEEKAQTNVLSSSCHSSFDSGGSRFGPKPLRGCMSVTSLEESLRNAEKSTDPLREDISAHSAPALLLSDGTKRPERNVSFTKIEWREYERALSDNPSVSVGPALGIGWVYNDAGSVEIEDYEKKKCYRRDATQLRIPSRVRESILREEWGVSRQDLQKATKEINITKNQRRKTQATMELENTAVAVESAVRKFKRLAGLKPRKSKEDQQLWKNAEGYAQEVNQQRRHSDSFLTAVKEEESCQQESTPCGSGNPLGDSEDDDWAMGDGLDLEKIATSSSE
mmetsp:Transcript_11319/g.17510  ORF Transcript_11319/g.17510 Transcript_11319/m.17510 type:complete len:302 (+) Transcript_11319:195-1100(+)